MTIKSWPADKVERWAIERLTPYAKNSRIHTETQTKSIAKSIKKFGWVNPLLVDESGVLICGHARVLAAQQLGLKEVPVMVAAGWSEADKRAYGIADNRLGESKFDQDMLVMELGDLASAGYELQFTGFDADSLADLLSPMTKLDVDSDETDAAPPPSITVNVPNAIDIPSVAAVLRKAIKASGYQGVKVREPKAPVA